MRRALIAKIKVAQKELGLDDTTYRAVLERVTGKRSCADMDVSELESVVADMRSHGFKPKAKGNPHGKPHLRRTSSAAMLDKVEALLTVGGKHWNYAHAMARRMFGKDKVEYLDDTQLHKLVAALQIAENRKTEKASGDDGVRKS